MSASITSTRVDVFDAGFGADIKVSIIVTLDNGEVHPHKLELGDLGLTPTQISNLQSALDSISTRAKNVTKTNFTIP